MPPKCEPPTTSRGCFVHKFLGMWDDGTGEKVGILGFVCVELFGSLFYKEEVTRGRRDKRAMSHPAIGAVSPCTRHEATAPVGPPRSHCQDPLGQAPRPPRGQQKTVANWAETRSKCSPLCHIVPLEPRQGRHREQDPQGRGLLLKRDISGCNYITQNKKTKLEHSAINAGSIDFCPAPSCLINSRCSYEPLPAQAGLCDGRQAGEHGMAKPLRVCPWPC